MRLYAFLLLTGAALCARAASIPVAETEKKIIDIVPDNFDKLSENTSSEQELIDQANTIKDVDNKLRAKPEDIPVEVIAENAQLPLLTGEEQDEEINRPVPDLRNPGPPQRQEHETQNPEYYASEQQTVALFKKSINDAQNVFKQGVQGITDGIQNIIETNAPIQTLQQNIQALRDNFTAQMIKVNGTIQSYLKSGSATVDKPSIEQTKAGFHQIEQGLFKLRNDFNRGVSTLAGGAEVIAALKDDSETPNESSSSTSTPPAVWPIPQFVQNIQHQWQSMQIQMQHAVGNMSQQLTNLAQSLSSNSNATASQADTAGVQSDSEVTPSPLLTLIQGIQNSILQIFPQNQSWRPFQQAVNNMNAGFSSSQSNKPAQDTQPAPSGQPAQTPSKPEEAVIKPDIKPQPEAEPAKPTAGAATPAQAAAVTPAGPIRQILQNNPITQGLAGAVQRLQNINNPEKPRDEQTSEQVKNLDDDKADPESKKGGGPNTGDNNDSSDSRVEQPEEFKEEIDKLPEVQKVPEVQKASEDEIKEHKTDEVVDKTE